MARQRDFATALVALMVTAMMTATPAVVSADSDHITEQANVTYSLDRRHEQVDVSSSFTITNRIPTPRPHASTSWGGARSRCRPTLRTSG